MQPVMHEFPQPPQGNPGADCWIALLSNFDGCSDCRAVPVNSDADDMASFNQQIDLLSRLISAAELRQEVIGHNVANVNTPNYRRLDVNFEAALAQEMARGKQSGTLDSATVATVTRTPGLQARADGNNVDIDMEVGQMNKNALLQQVYLQMVGAEVNMMRKAIDGR